VSARDELLQYMEARSKDSGYDTPEDADYCEKLVDAYAHELAEKIRAHGCSCCGNYACRGNPDGADLIDPEVE
jgi:hypothetical protein